MRDGSYAVYRKGSWIGTAVPMATGQWAYISRADDELVISMTLEGLAVLIEREEEDDNGILIAKGSR